MTRRELMTVAALTTTSLFAGVALADEKSADTSGSLSKEKLKKAVDASFDCLKKGEACYAHCLDMLSKGDTSMKNCHQTLQNMLAACTALSKVGSYNSAKPEAIKHLAQACGDLCKECVVSCKEHAAHHAVCKTCMESCQHCADACDDLVG